MEKLLVRNWKDRLGTIGGAKEILAHPWFANYDFESLENRTKQMSDLQEGEMELMMPMLAPGATSNFEDSFAHGGGLLGVNPSND